MEFVAETVRLTSLSSRQCLIGREPLVLNVSTARITTRSETRQAVMERWNVSVSYMPEEWQVAEAELTGFQQADVNPLDAEALVTAVTRTTHFALEAWAARTSDGTWPYLVMPWVNTAGTVGAPSACSRDWMTFSGQLYHSWHGATDTWYEPEDSSRFTERLVPLVAVEDGRLWGVGKTDAPPPATTSAQARASLRADDVEWQRRRYGAYV
jgi:hypothetical protein